MNVQISVLLWTGINFCILMLVLSKLLFKPLLSFMDARREKIDSARAAREESAKESALALEKERGEREAREKQAVQDALAALEEAKSAAMQETAKKEREYSALVENTRCEVEAEKQEIRRSMDAGMEDLVTVFVQKLAY